VSGVNACVSRTQAPVARPQPEALTFVSPLCSTSTTLRFVLLLTHPHGVFRRKLRPCDQQRSENAIRRRYDAACVTASCGLLETTLRALRERASPRLGLHSHPAPDQQPGGNSRVAAAASGRDRDAGKRVAKQPVASRCAMAPPIVAHPGRTARAAGHGSSRGSWGSSGSRARRSTCCTTHQRHRLHCCNCCR
jgi:hypothetical protein